MKGSTKLRIPFSLLTPHSSFLTPHFSLLFACFCACLLGAATLSAQTQLGAGINGEAAGDRSGESVSLSSDGLTVAIEAIYNADNGAGAGHVRVYQMPITCPATGSIWFVDAAAASGGNGASWECAFQNLQDAIDAASSGHEVWVKAGTYLPTKDPFGNATPADPRDKTFYLKNGVAVYGGFAGTEAARSQRNWTANVTTLSGDLNGDDAGFTNNTENAYHVVLSVSDGNTTVLNGFTVTKGNAENFGTITVETKTIDQRYGGGIHCHTAPITIANCIFMTNRAHYGAAMNNFIASPTVTACVFRGNHSTTTGGGMWNYQSSPTVTNCSFTGNHSGTGGGILNTEGCSPILTNCTFSGNRVTSGGGGVSNGYGASPVFKNCIVWNNRAGSNTGSAISGVYNENTNPPASFSATYSLIQNQTPSGTGNLDGTTNAANSNYPNFVTPLNPATAPSTAGDFHLQAVTPVANVGTSTGAPATDLFGNARPFGAAYDLGVHELQAANTPTCPATGSIWYVDAAVADGGDGSSWECAFQNLQDAIDAASSGHEIWVKAGTYLPTSYPTGCSGCDTDRDKTFHLKSGVKVYGGFAGTETMLSQRNWTTNPTILSGDLGTSGDNSDNAHHVVLSANDASTTVLDGFTVTKGNANTGGSITTESSIIYESRGGGIYLISGAMTIANCILSENAATAGGGIYSISTSATLNKCSFLSNTVSGDGSDGGGWYSFNTACAVTDCLFAGNVAGSSGTSQGGGLHFESSSGSSTFSNCLFTGNTSGGGGGGVFASSAAAPLFINCTISGNKTTATGGGGLAVSNSSQAAFTNCIVWNNQSSIGTTDPISNLSISNAAVPVFSYSLIQGQTPSGTGNLNGTTNVANSNYPNFTTPLDPGTAPSTAGDFHFATSCSPAIETGTNTGAPATDLFGNARPFGTNVDLGVHEYHGAGVCSIAGTVWYVDASASGCQVGTSWNCAFSDLQDAIDAASSGHEIWVKAGTYLPTAYPSGCSGCTTDRDKALHLKSGVKIYGGFDGSENARSQRNWTSNVTTLSGDIGTAGDNSDNCYHVVYSASNTAATELNGFTITKGNANSSSGFRAIGAGIYCSSSNMTITNCIITSNNAGISSGSCGGAGIYNRFSNPNISNCTFSANTATTSSIASGGAMFNSNSSPIVSNCIFSGNSCVYQGGAVYNNTNPSPPQFINCTFTGNSAAYAGAMHNQSSATVISNCTFSGNTATADGGGMYNISSITATNCLFTGNTAANGAGVYNNGTGHIFTNCTLTGNKASTFAAFYNFNSNPTLTNCIIWNNRSISTTGNANSALYNFGTSAPTISYSLIQAHNPSGTGNLDGIPNAADANYPNFVTPLDPATAPSTAGDFHLTSCSPVLNLGTNTGAPTTDLFGNTRPFATTVDMGVHELQSASAVPTTATAGPDQTLCPTAPATLAANTPSVGAGAWSVVSGPSTSTAQFSSLTNPAATFTPTGGAGAYTLRWTISNSPCTASTDDVVITFNALPTITLGANPSVFPGTTSANLPYTATTDSPDQYSIDYSAAANTAGFVDVTNASLPASPIVLTVPSGAVAATYNATLTVRNSTTGCVSSATAFTVTISSCPSLFTVNDLGDAVDATPGNGVCAIAGGGCTLRAAIQEANALTGCSPITINITATGTITLGNALPGINHPNLTINGPGASSLMVSGANLYRPFTINSNKTVTIANLTITNGNATGTGGGGLLNNGTLTLNSCAISNNNSTAQAGGIQNSNTGTLMLNGCTVHNNTAPQGGGIQNDKVLTMTDCTINGNSAPGVGNNGGGLVMFGTTTTLTNCTISGNSAGNTGGGFYIPTGTLTLTNCTVTGNTANAGGGLRLSGNTHVLINTIVVGNGIENPLYEDEIWGTVSAASSNNLLGADGTGGLTDGVNGNQIIASAANALLGSLNNYGGATQTIPLLPGSPAIDGGTATGVPTNDQRGIARVGNVDIGAFESRGFTLAVNGGNNQSTAAGSAFGTALSVTVTSANSEPVNGGQVTFTPPGSGASCTLGANPATISSGAASSTATANTTIGGPYTVSAGANGATSVNFSLTNTNSAPTFTPAAAISRQQGAPAGAAVTIGTVADAQTAAGSLTLTQIAGGTAAGITVTGISNTGGTISAVVTAACTATPGTVRFQVSDGNLTGIGDLQVNVTAATTPTAAIAGPNQTFCATAPTTLAANMPSVGAGAWSVVTGPSTSSAQFNSLSNPAATFTPAGGVGTYTLRWTITGDCAISTSEVVLTYNANPTLAAAGDDQTSSATCGQTQVTLAANAPTVGTGEWSVQSGTGGSFGDASSPMSTFSGNAGATYTLRWTISNPPCSPSTDEMVVTFRQNPTPAIAGPDQTGAATCGQTQVTLAATAPTAGTGAWSVQSGTGGSFGDASSPASTFSGTAGNTYTLRWTVTSPPCAPSTDDVTVTFNQAPSFSACPPGVTVSATAGCSATADYTATAVPAANVAYTFGGATTGSGSGSGSGQPFNLGTTAVSLTATNTCGSSSCFFIVVVQAPEISAQGNATTILDGDNTPSASDHTDFGQTNGASVVRTFTVQNTGAAPLNVTAITLAGTDPGQFSVGPLTPASPVPVGQSATFAVTYAPNSAAVHNATVNVANGDCDEATYNFDVRGELTCTAPAFTACPSNLPPVNASEGQCSAAVGYDATASGLPAPNLTYAFSGATTGSGSGTGSGSNFSAGTTTVTVTATNPCGAPTCTFTVTVLDAHPPSITCPDNISKNTDANQCTAVTNYTSPTFSDNCSGATLTRTSGPASGAAFPKGTTMVEWKATDAAGLSSVCQFTVTVTDAQQPSIACPANLVRNTGTGQCSAVVTYTNPTYSDNCAGAGLDHVSGGTSGTAFPKGTTPVIWQATDAANNTKRCTFTVTVNDNQLPAINCPANQTKGTDAGLCSAVTDYTVTATDNCSGVTATLHSGLASGQPFPKGINIVQWKATDAAGLTRTCSFRVTVNDTQAPTTACPPSQSLNTDPNLCGAVATYNTPTAADNCAPPPTVLRTSGLASGSAFPKGVSAVTWKATDGAGLTKTCSFTVTVTDVQLPTVTCPANLSVTGGGSPCVAMVNYTTPTGTDNCEVQSVSLMSGLGSGSVFPAGTTTVLWRAMDNSGLSATCAFTVTVSCGSSPSQPSRRGGAATSLTTSRSAVASPPLREGWEGLMLSLSPNPASDRAVIEVLGLPNTVPAELAVHDLQGRLMWQQRFGPETLTSGQTAIELDDRWKSGVYLVTLRSEEGQTVTKRLVVQRL